ncbi:hypothetical protein CV093_17910 [Oceanobacillus sp. 143]|nr:hypothetical protein CV093_17910 [Oceanobacillus sp. 143]
MALFKPTAYHPTENAIVWRQRRWANVNYDDNLLSIAGRSFVKNNSKDKLWRYNYADNQMLVSSYHISKNTIENLYNAIVKFRPRYVQGYPSSIALLSNYLIENNLKINGVKAIFTSSETLFPNQREVIERAFGAKILDYYGNGENVSSAVQCEYGTYHLNNEYSYTEITKENSIIGTNLYNYAMPLIRYETGDSAEISKHTCACGRNLPVIKNLNGRTGTNYVSTLDGRKIANFNKIIINIKKAKEIQIHQKENYELVINIVPREEFNKKDREDIINNIKDYLGNDMSVVLNFTSTIPRSKSGKFIPVISEVK